MTTCFCGAMMRFKPGLARCNVCGKMCVAWRAGRSSVPHHALATAPKADRAMSQAWRWANRVSRALQTNVPILVH